MEVIPLCSGYNDIQKRFRGALKAINARYPDLKELFPWKRKIKRPQEVIDAEKAAKAQRMADAEKARAERIEFAREEIKKYKSLFELSRYNSTLYCFLKRNAPEVLDGLRSNRPKVLTPELIEQRKQEVRAMLATVDNANQLRKVKGGYYTFAYKYMRDEVDAKNAEYHRTVAANHANPEWVKQQQQKHWANACKKKKALRLSTRDKKWADDPIYQLSHHSPTDRVWTNQQKLELFSHFTHYSEVCTLLGKTIEELGSHFFSVANNVEGFITPSNEILAQREQRRQEREELKRQAEAERQALAQRRQAAIDYCSQPGATRIEFQRLFPKEWGCKYNIPELFALLEQLPQQTTEDVMQQVLVVDHKPVETYKPDTQAILAANPPRYRSTLQWTEERLRNLIIERGYRTPTELRKEYRRAQTVLYQRFPHLLSLFPDYRSQSDLAEKRRLWTLDYCIERCKPFLTVKESKAAQSDLESWIYHHGWNTVCHAHMKGSTSKPRGMRYSTTYHIIQQSRTREQFQQEHPDLYEYALTVKSLREAMDMHFPNVERIERHNRESIRLWQERNPLFRQPDGNGGTMRCIYVCEFPDNHAYVGLTDNPDKRRREHGWKNHIPDSAVAAYKFQTGQKYQFKILADFMPELEAQEAEGYWKQQYIDQGWQMLNRAPTGSLGGSPRFYNPIGLEDGNKEI